MARKFPKSIKVNEITIVYKHKDKVVWNSNSWSMGDIKTVKNPEVKLDDVLTLIWDFLEPDPKQRHSNDWFAKSKPVKKGKRK